jgi:hypothetical protein
VSFSYKRPCCCVNWGAAGITEKPAAPTKSQETDYQEKFPDGQFV